ncbi:DUF4234 domain-containing protein [Candidatus Woesearchaeota archaeon]|nr:DUF4234 domain-containing protein [Candidatus Woesearchaeota archaeon]
MKIIYLAIMITKELIDYVRSAKASGMSPNDVRKALSEQGWPQEDIDEAIKTIGGTKADSAAKPAMPEQKTRSEPMTSKESTAQPSASPAGGVPVQPGGIKKRNPILVLIFSLITFGIYFLYWLVKTTKELRGNTPAAPNPWIIILFLIPFVNLIAGLYYYWKYSKAINEITGFNAILLFVLWILFFPAAQIISQMQLNKKAA